MLSYQWYRQGRLQTRQAYRGSSKHVDTRLDSLTASNTTPCANGLPKMPVGTHPGVFHISKWQGRYVRKSSKRLLRPMVLEACRRVSVSTNRE